jgi:oligopeptide transport system substrate-binding protein
MRTISRLTQAGSVLLASLAMAAVLAGTGTATDARYRDSTNALRFNIPLRIDSLDPAIAFFDLSWQIEYATCVKLVNYPDLAAPGGQEVRPEAAVKMPRVSADGLTYTFVVPPGRFTFSPPSNEKVTAANFKRAIERSLDPTLRDYAVAYMHDVVGVDDFVAGRASSVSGVTVQGAQLRIQLTHRAPDLLQRLAMPFFCAVPVDTPSVQSEGLPSAGPYYVASVDFDGVIVLEPNPNYKGERPQNWSEIDINAWQDPAVTEAAILAGDVDLGAVPRDDMAALGAAYGAGSPAALAGHQQFFVDPALNFQYLVLNSGRLNTALRQAVNFAIDRNALAAAAGAYGATPTDQLIPFGVPGFQDAAIYPFAGDQARAAALAAPYLPATLEIYTIFNQIWQARAQIVKANLEAIGFTVNVHVFERGEELDRVHTPGEPFDIAFEGWNLDYDDPFDVINVIFHSGYQQNVGHFSDPVFDQRMGAAAELSGDARYAVYAQLDADLMRDAAPAAPFAVANARSLFSARIGCQTYSPPFGMDLVALCLR